MQFFLIFGVTGKYFVLLKEMHQFLVVYSAWLMLNALKRGLDTGYVQLFGVEVEYDLKSGVNFGRRQGQNWLSGRDWVWLLSLWLLNFNLRLCPFTFIDIFLFLSQPFLQKQNLRLKLLDLIPDPFNFLLIQLLGLYTQLILVNLLSIIFDKSRNVFNFWHKLIIGFLLLLLFDLIRQFGLGFLWGRV